MKLSIINRPFTMGEWRIYLRLRLFKGRTGIIIHRTFCSRNINNSWQCLRRHTSFVLNNWLHNLLQKRWIPKKLKRIAIGMPPPELKLRPETEVVLSPAVFLTHQQAGYMLSQKQMVSKTTFSSMLLCTWISLISDSRARIPIVLLILA